MGIKRVLPKRAYLLHLTHYDPVWFKAKPRERPFDLDLALEIVEALAEERFTLLVVDCADALAYRSHPEFARRYTVPMKQLEAITAAARTRGLDVAPKLNFSRSEINTHNHWQRAAGEHWYSHFDDAYWWKTAFECADEVIAACGATGYFHVGMDEDTERSYTQYCEVVKGLRSGLKQRKLRMLMWNDTGIKYASGMLHHEKSLAAERSGPKDIIHVLWQYGTVPVDDIARIRTAGYELWGAPGWKKPEQAIGFRDSVAHAGGKGLLMTTWMPCQPKHRPTLLDGIRAMGPIYRGENQQ